MKLGRTYLAAVIFTTWAVACASPARRPASEPLPDTVGTTSLMTAELPSAEEAPRVGKSYRAEVAEDEVKGVPERDSRRPCGGFSGYK